jgi:hypothetical protein
MQSDGKLQSDIFTSPLRFIEVVDKQFTSMCDLAPDCNPHVWIFIHENWCLRASTGEIAEVPFDPSDSDFLLIMSWKAL